MNQDLILGNFKVYSPRPSSDGAVFPYTKFLLFLEDSDAMPWTIFDRQAKRHVLPILYVKNEEASAMEEHLNDLIGTHVEVLFNAYGQISQIRAI